MEVRVGCSILEQLQLRTPARVSGYIYDSVYTKFSVALIYHKPNDISKW